ncbi:hypothetical protein YC2023_070518 [Brassica napus]
MVAGALVVFFSSATPPFHLFVHLCTLSFDKGGVQLRWSPFSDPVVPVQSGACLAPRLFEQVARKSSINLPWFRLRCSVVRGYVVTVLQARLEFVGPDLKSFLLFFGSSGGLRCWCEIDNIALLTVLLCPLVLYVVGRLLWKRSCPMEKL